MTAEREAMTLEHVRARLRDLVRQAPDEMDSVIVPIRELIGFAHAIDAHLSRAAGPVGFVLRDATPPYDYYGDSFVLGEPQEDETDELQWAPLYAAPTAGARPIAWTRIEDIKDDEGRAIGTDEPRIVWGAKCPDYEEGWSPLYAGPTHPPEPARDSKRLDAIDKWTAAGRRIEFAKSLYSPGVEIGLHEPIKAFARNSVREAIDAAMAQESGE